MLSCFNPPGGFNPAGTCAHAPIGDRRPVSIHPAALTPPGLGADIQLIIPLSFNPPGGFNPAGTAGSNRGAKGVKCFNPPGGFNPAGTTAQSKDVPSSGVSIHPAALTPPGR